MKSLASSPPHDPVLVPFFHSVIGRRSHASMMRCSSSSVNGTLLATLLAPFGGFRSLDTGPTDFGSEGSRVTHFRFAQNRKKLRRVPSAFPFERAPNFHAE